MKQDYDVLIIGGGPSGLSAAMTLGRIRRKALLCDDDRPRNAPSSHVNNFPTQDGIHPAEWRRLARRDLEKYQSIESFQGRVIRVRTEGHGFQAELSSGKIVSTRKVILAYGVKDTLAPIPGLQELWGKAVFHCPFCHGFEIAGSPLGMIANNDMAFHALLLLRNLSPDLIFFTNGKSNLSEEHHQMLKKMNVPLVEDKIAALDHEGDTLRAVVLDDGRKIARPYLFYAPEMPFELKSQIGAQLGCEKNQFGFYKVNERGGTTVPGVFACGDNMSMAHSVLLASASGVMAGLGALSELITEDAE